MILQLLKGVRGIQRISLEVKVKVDPAAAKCESLLLVQFMLRFI